jgi:hypothetical protein
MYGNERQGRNGQGRNGKGFCHGRAGLRGQCAMRTGGDACTHDGMGRGQGRGRGHCGAGRGQCMRRHVQTVVREASAQEAGAGAPEHAEP